jgi:hypothetical protein
LAGEKYPEEIDLFVPLDIKHLKEWKPEILKYLALPPGYLFLIGEGEDEYEDVWFDDTLLEN